MPESSLVIITVGPERSGLIAEVTSAIADFGYNIEDLDQVVMHGIFILSLLVDLSHGIDGLDRLRSKLNERCRDLGLEVTYYYSAGK
jgi:predicted amino acid-binding ACT domain protein